MSIGAEQTPAKQTTQADLLFNQRNYKEAWEAFEKLAKRKTATDEQVEHALNRGMDCLERLGRQDEIDAFREEIADIHSDSWQALQAVADSYIRRLHHGFIVEGEFARGNRRGGGRGAEYVDASARDRVRALQLMQQALPLVEADAAKNAKKKGDFFFRFADALLFNRNNSRTSWQLQLLTNISELPDYETGNRWQRFGGSSTPGAPVDEAGTPIYYSLPDSWKAAENDGERWRWLLSQAETVNPAVADQVAYTWANFLHGQFGVQTMRNQILPLLKASAEEGEEPDLNEKTGPFAVRTLEESETIAKLANGVKRFTLPDEFNFIKVYQQLAENGGDKYAAMALEQLGGIFENRQQYPKAAEYWREVIKRFGDNDSRSNRLSQIVDPWGQFEGSSVQPSGEGAQLDFRFRNGDSVQLEAREINYQQLLKDVKAYLKSNPQKWDWNQVNIGNIGHRLVAENETKYLGKKVANWSIDLEPRPEHRDKRIEITTPLQKAGAYLLTAKMKGGNTTRVIVWLDDLAIVKKTLDKSQWYFVADAKTGQPIPNAKLNFFGYNLQRQARNQMTTKISEFLDQTDADGQVMVGQKRMEQGFNWLVTATGPNNSFAYLGFNGVWYQNHNWDEYQQNKVYIITDRPVYRPGQTVKFKTWVRRADYGRDEDKAMFADKEFKFQIVNPRNEKLLEEEFTTDKFGGFDGEITLPEDATLGVYQLQLPWDGTVSGNNTFRVEEYKKPEFEVTVEAPDKPIELGETVTATIKAKYYFGAPVTQGTVKYKVERTKKDSRWFPIEPWDWLYGNGYAWFGRSYDWYPGFSRWGCLPPIPPWWGHSSDPPELVLENEVPIGPDGTVKVEIDTALAKAIHGDSDHSYNITAEVVDESRRTIVGNGSVLAARDPFQVHVWVNRGYYHVGDAVIANVKGQTIDSRPIEGEGELTLYAITYNDKGQPEEQQVDSWKLATDEQGTATQKFEAARPGQYRLSYKLTNSEGHEQEGAYIFLVRGKDSTLADFRFDDLEVTPDKKTYQPGETVRLLINTNRQNSTVLLFVRPSGGVYVKPQTIRLNGKSTVVDLGVEARDMPNFFVEAMTVSDANVFQEARDIPVPPEKRVINVEVTPSKESYKPGEEAEVTLQLTDLDGNPIEGTSVVTVYDRAVEYIAGGSNVPDMQEFFWQFRRSHHPSYESSLQRHFGLLFKRNEKRMQNLGVFGHLTADEPGVAQRNAPVRMMMERSRAVDSFADDAAMAAPAMELAAGAAPMAKAAADKDAGGENLVEPTIRKEFADTAYWNALVTPDENGKAVIRFPMPENLTDWKILTWSLGQGTRVGSGQASAVTAKDVLVRLQAPRFFVEKDEVIISANVHNYLKSSKQARVEIVLEGNTLEPLDETRRTITIEADGEQRVDWRVKATAEGDAVITVKALTDEDSDAMQMTFPVYVHGMLKTESYTGTIRPDEDSKKFTINVPEERRPEQSRLEVRYSPTLAGAMVDALPYLIDYPYGCTEQTLNRFLPSVITQNILQRMNLDLEAIQQKRTNLNAQEIGDAEERAKQWKRFDRNPVFDNDEMQEIVKTNLKKLVDMQLSDGGWGWFSGRGERSYPHTTATVVHGLQVAVDNGLLLPEGVLEDGVKWLEKYQTEQVRLLKKGQHKEPKHPYRRHVNNLDALVYMVLVDADVQNQEMQDFLYNDRAQLSVYSLAMFGLSLHSLEAAERFDMVLRNIEQYYVEDLENETAYLKLPEGGWWYWYNSDIEANAYYLKLLAKTDPEGERAPRLVKYLLNNRKHATYWNSTRDTSLCIEAMADYLIASGEDSPNFTLEILVDGEVKKSVEINKDNLFSFDGTLLLTGEELTSGKHDVEFRKKGNGPLYWNAYLTNFTLEDPITATGLELKIRRKVYKLVEQEDASADVAGSRGQAVSQRVVKYDRVELKTGDEVRSGDLLEIELGIDSKNDYEYILLEDFKAAGTEPTDLRSGYLPDANGAYVEFRDEKVAFFMRTLPRGTSSMSYRLRAEIPGNFSALPAITYGMYAPELKGNSNEFKLQIEDRE